MLIKDRSHRQGTTTLRLGHPVRLKARLSEALLVSLSVQRICQAHTCVAWVTPAGVGVGPVGARGSILTGIRLALVFVLIAVLPHPAGFALTPVPVWENTHTE